MRQRIYYRLKLQSVWLALLTLLLIGVTNAASQSEKDVWLIVKDGGRGLEIPDGVIVRCSGAGELSYDEQGRMRLHDGCVVKVNGQVVGEKRVTRQDGIVQIVSESKGTVLELKPGPDARLPGRSSETRILRQINAALRWAFLIENAVQFKDEAGE